jgi:hypothetical protein
LREGFLKKGLGYRKGVADVKKAFLSDLKNEISLDRSLMTVKTRWPKNL